MIRLLKMAMPNILNMNTPPYEVSKLSPTKYRRDLSSIYSLEHITTLLSLLLHLFEKCQEIAKHSVVRFHRTTSYTLYELAAGYFKRYATSSAKRTCLAFLKYNEMIINDGIEDNCHEDERTINQMLVTGSVDFCGFCGFSPLHVALLMNEWSLVHKFIKYGADRNPYAEYIYLFDSPLRLAIAVHAPEDVIRVLIHPDTINEPEYGYGETHLQQAVKSRSWNTVSVLLEKGAEWKEYHKRMPKPDSLILQSAMTVRKRVEAANQDFDHLHLPPVLKDYATLRNIVNCIKELESPENEDTRTAPSVDENMQRYFLKNPNYQSLYDKVDLYTDMMFMDAHLVCLFMWRVFQLVAAIFICPCLPIFVFIYTMLWPRVPSIRFYLDRLRAWLDF